MWTSLKTRHLRFHISPHFCPASPLPRLLRVVSSVWPRIILQCHTATVGFHVNQYPVTIRGSLNQVIHLPYSYTQLSLKVLRYSNVPLPLPLQTPLPTSNSLSPLQTLPPSKFSPPSPSSKFPPLPTPNYPSSFPLRTPNAVFPILPSPSLH